MITDYQYQKLCEVTDALREATDNLYAANECGSRTEMQTAARNFATTEAAWEAFVLALVETK